MPGIPKLPAVSRTMSPVIEKRPPPSPIPQERVLPVAPPSTPMSQEPKPESLHGIQGTPNETAHEQRSVKSHEDLPPGSPTGSTSSRRRKTRKKAKPGLLSTKLISSLALENSGSVARDHLASERTFLAYVRTSLLLATTGVALVQLFAVATTNSATSNSLRRIRAFAHPLGATLIIFGLLVLGVGIRRYFVIQSSLTKGLFPVSRLAMSGITIILAAIIIVLFGVLVSARLD